MSAWDYWSDLAEAEQVGVKAPPPRVYRIAESEWGLRFEGSRLRRYRERMQEVQDEQAEAHR